MKQSDLVRRIYDKNQQLSKQQVEKSVELIHSMIVGTLANHGRVELRGFGVFFTCERASRQVRNPMTGKYFHVPVRHIPRFKAGKKLRLEVNAAASK